jgi:uncharacterized protein YndB with AHSA1/START domain
MSADLIDVDLSRTFDAPVDRVWRAWTESDQVMRWWGPLGFTAPVARMDVREGGTSLVCMRSPDGHDLYNTWTYRRVVPLEELEFVLNFADADGTTVAPADLGLPPDIPAPVRHLVTFRDLGGDRTELRVVEFGYTSAQTRDLSAAGLAQCLDKMAASFATPG